MEYILLSLLALNVLQTGYLVTKTGVGRAARRRNPVFIDTSVLIDGRIQAVAETGFVQGEFFIPRSVIAELQYMADNADGDKRARARHGLDVASALQASRDADVKLHHDSRSTKDGVDNQLLALAKKYNGAICTIDYNLNKVAQVEGIRVLNINELARQLRAEYLPGEKTSVHVLQKGNDAHQGVGYLNDGTMVVIEQASGSIGKNVDIEVIRSIQTDAGRMIFAKLVKQREKVDTKMQTVHKQVAKSGAGRKPTRAGAAQHTANSTQAKKTNSSRGRSRTNEDRLVELANQ